MKCSNCNEELEENAKFCSQCGTKVELISTVKDKNPRFFNSFNLTEQKNFFSIHKDLRGLLWIADGPYKNYIEDDDSFFYSPETLPYKNNSSYFKVENFEISFSMEEPSLIYTKEKIIIPDDIYDIERPPYCPTYKGLTPRQKGVYIHLLQNPYDKNINIGYVFLLYYGLEKYLLTEKWKEAVDVIIKLRAIHSNASFQSYSGNALILASLYTKQGQMALDLINSIDMEKEIDFSGNLLLLCCHDFNIPINANIIIKLSKIFGFTNLNYIKKERKLFEKILKNNLIKQYGTDKLILSNIISEQEMKKISFEKMPIFANLSIRDIEISVPMIIEIKSFKNSIFRLLNETHNQVKQELINVRKKRKDIL